MKQYLLLVLAVIGLVNNPTQLYPISEIGDFDYEKRKVIKKRCLLWGLDTTIGVLILSIFTLSPAMVLGATITSILNVVIYTRLKACKNNTVNLLSILLFGGLIYGMALNSHILGLILFTALHFALDEEKTNWRLIIFLVALASIIF